MGGGRWVEEGGWRKVGKKWLKKTKSTIYLIYRNQTTPLHHHNNTHHHNHTTPPQPHHATTTTQHDHNHTTTTTPPTISPFMRHQVELAIQLSHGDGLGVDDLEEDLQGMVRRSYMFSRSFPPSHSVPSTMTTPQAQTYKNPDTETHKNTDTQTHRHTGTPPCFPEGVSCEPAR